jgi:hypothetical protein
MSQSGPQLPHQLLHAPEFAMLHLPTSTTIDRASDLANEHLDLEPLCTVSEAVSERPVVHTTGKSSSTNLKKAWKKPIDKPKRPLSAYNIFFKHEREKIITGDNDVNLEDVLFRVKHTLKPTKRRHRKSHGMIGFAQLAKTIAEKWKVLDRTEKAVYEAKAAIEKGKYSEQLDEWERLREEKLKEDKHLSPLEPTSLVFEDDDESPIFSLSSWDKPTSCNFRPCHDTLSSLLTVSNSQMHLLNQKSHPIDVRDYLSMTQQTLDMARATLAYPLFASLPVQSNIHTVPDHHGLGLSPCNNLSSYYSLQVMSDSSQKGSSTANVPYQGDYNDYSGHCIYAQESPSEFL